MQRGDNPPSQVVLLELNLYLPSTAKGKKLLSQDIKILADNNAANAYRQMSGPAHVRI